MTMPLRFRRPTLLLWSAPLLMATLSGCSLFEVPEQLQLPAAPTMPPLQPKFTPTDGSTRGTSLNVVGSATLPDAYRAVRVEIQPLDPVGGPGTGLAGGQVIVYLQKVEYAPGSVVAGAGTSPGTAPDAGRALSGGTAPSSAASGNAAAANASSAGVLPQPAPDATRPARGARTPVPTPTLKAGALPIPVATPSAGVLLGDTAPVKLAGVLVPLNEPFRTAAVNTLINWLVNNDPSNPDPKKGDLDVDQDKVYPFDLQGRARVQIFFKGRSGATKGQLLNLNRLMVRSGYAVTDLYSPTTFDVNVWFNDEQIARGLVSGSQPVGLWRYPGFELEHRVSPTPTPKATFTPAPGAVAPRTGAPGAGSGVPTTGNAVGGATGNTTRTTQTTQTQITSNSTTVSNAGG